MPLPPPTGPLPPDVLAVLALLACPACHGPLLAQPPLRILCASCKRIYPVRDGIPVLIVAEANFPEAFPDTSPTVPVQVPLD